LGETTILICLELDKNTLLSKKQIYNFESVIIKKL